MRHHIKEVDNMAWHKIQDLGYHLEHLSDKEINYIILCSLYPDEQSNTWLKYNMEL